MKYYIYILFIILMYSCANDNEQSGICVINVACKKQLEVKDVSIKNYCCNRKIIRLETTEESIFTNADRLILHDNKIIIYDEIQDAVLIFDDTGSFLRKIKKIGKGPDEYVQLIDITIHNNEIVMHCAIPEKLIYYNFEGDFLKMEKREFNDVFISSINSSIVYASYADSKNEKYIKIENGNDVKEYLPVEKHLIGKHFYGMRPNLIRSSALYFFKSYDSFIYKVDANGCSPVYKISLTGKKFIDGSELISSPSLDELTRGRSNNILKINDFRDSKSYVTFTMFPYHRIIIYDKEEERTTIVKNFYDNEVGISLNANNYIGHDGNSEQVLFSVEAIQFINNLNNIEHIDNEAAYNEYKEIANDLTPNDNPIIIIYDYK